MIKSLQEFFIFTAIEPHGAYLCNNSKASPLKIFARGKDNQLWSIYRTSRYPTDPATSRDKMNLGP